MWRKAVWLLPVGAVVAFLLVRSPDRGHTVPETFPTLDPTEVEGDTTPPGGTELATFGPGASGAPRPCSSRSRG
jgi:hypothetical protein